MAQSHSIAQLQIYDLVPRRQLREFPDEILERGILRRLEHRFLAHDHASVLKILERDDQDSFAFDGTESITFFRATLKGIAFYRVDDCQEIR